MQVWPMRKLSEDERGVPFDADGWHHRAQAIREVFFRTLGSTPASQYFRGYEAEKPVLNGEVKRTLLRITVDEDDVMEAWLLEPADGREPAGVALAPHGTSAHGKDLVAGLADNTDGAYGLELARRGWIVLAPDGHAVCRRYAKGLDPYDTAKFYERFPEWSSVGKIITDMRACLDVFGQLPQTKGRSVSAIGHSLGAQTSIYAAIGDERVSQCVCNCGIYPFSDSIARAHWFRTLCYIYYNDEALRKSVIDGPQPLWDFHEIAALVAPRRLLISFAPNDYCCGHFEGVSFMIQQLHRVWGLLKADRHLTCVLHNEGHAFERWHRQFAYEWLEGGATGTVEQITLK